MEALQMRSSVAVYLCYRTFLLKIVYTFELLSSLQAGQLCLWHSPGLGSEKKVHLPRSTPPFSLLKPLHFSPRASHFILHSMTLEGPSVLPTSLPSQSLFTAAPGCHQCFCFAASLHFPLMHSTPFPHFLTIRPSLKPQIILWPFPWVLALVHELPEPSSF